MGGVLGARAQKRRLPVEVQSPGIDEPCRFDLREHACFPYPPVENQGSEVTCVAHSFAMALYCMERGGEWDPDAAYYPELAEIFAEALRQSPDRSRGVSFDAVARGVEAAYGERMSRLGVSYQALPNSARAVRRALLGGAPVIAGYQVNEAIDRFHRDPRMCEQVGFVLPSFDEDSVSISGHAVLLLGYDFRVQAFIARNSWGESWGVNGHFLVPFSAAEDENAVSDLWALLPRRRGR